MKFKKLEKLVESFMFLSEATLPLRFKSIADDLVLLGFDKTKINWESGRAAIKVYRLAGDTVSIDEKLKTMQLSNIKNLIKSNEKLTGASGAQTYIIEYNDNVSEDIKTSLKYVIDMNPSGMSKQPATLKTMEAESAVGVFIVLLANTEDSFDELLLLLNEEDEDITFNMIKDNVDFGSTTLKSVIEFIKNNESDAQKAYDNAKAIVDYFPKISEYVVHRGSDTFDKIKKHGFELYKDAGGLGKQPDKWNPSDLFLIKSVDYPDDINEFNKIVGTLGDDSNQDVIGLSLKAGDDSSKQRHGSFNFSTLLGLFDIKLTNENKLEYIPDEFSNLEEFLNEEQITVIKNLSNKLGTKLGVPINFREGTQKQLSPGFINSIPLVLGGLESIIDKPDFIDTFKQSIITALAADALSCNFYKVIGKKIEESKKIYVDDITFDEVLVPITGASSVFVYFKVKDKSDKYRVDIRSSGGFRGDLPTMSIEMNR